MGVHKLKGDLDHHMGHPLPFLSLPVPVFPPKERGAVGRPPSQGCHSSTCQPAGLAIPKHLWRALIPAPETCSQRGIHSIRPPCKQSLGQNRCVFESVTQDPRSHFEQPVAWSLQSWLISSCPKPSSAMLFPSSKALRSYISKQLGNITASWLTSIQEALCPHWQDTSRSEHLLPAFLSPFIHLTENTLIA